MSKPAEEAKDGKVKRGDLTVVAEDVNWRRYVSTELRVANEFNENWGFLTAAAQGNKWLTCRRLEGSDNVRRQNCRGRVDSARVERQADEHDEQAVRPAGRESGNVQQHDEQHREEPRPDALAPQTRRQKVSKVKRLCSFSLVLQPFPKVAQDQTV